MNLRNAIKETLAAINSLPEELPITIQIKQGVCTDAEIAATVGVLQGGAQAIAFGYTRLSEALDLLEDHAHDVPAVASFLRSEWDGI